MFLLHYILYYFIHLILFSALYCPVPAGGLGRRGGDRSAVWLSDRSIGWL